MKPAIPIIVAIGLSLLAHALTGHAATDSKPLEPNAPRTITVSEADTPP
jgi:type IV secretion system protein VirB9